jgi:hypothetical protein
MHDSHALLVVVPCCGPVQVEVEPALLPLLPLSLLLLHATADQPASTNATNTEEKTDFLMPEVGQARRSHSIA